MSSVAEVRQIFDTYLDSNWDTTIKDWPNMSNVVPQKASWIKADLIIAHSFNTTIGTRRTRHSGDYIIRLYTPLNIGVGPGFLLASQLLALLENKRLNDDILTYAGSVRNIGDAGYGSYQFNILIPFTAES